MARTTLLLLRPPASRVRPSAHHVRRSYTTLETGQAASPSACSTGERPALFLEKLQLDGCPEDAAIERRSNLLSVSDKYHLLRGCKLVQNQFLAMFMKRALVAKRSWILHLVHLLFPSLIVLLTLVNRRNSESDLPALALSLDAYKQPITLIENPEASDDAATEIHNIYTDLLQDSKGNIEKVDSIRNVMLEHSEKIPTTVRYNYIVGASFKGPEGPAGKDGAGKRPAVITAWYNNDPLHSPPLALALVLSTAYRYMLKKKISFVHHPLPYTGQNKIKRIARENSSSKNVAGMTSMSMAFVSAFYILFYVRENTSKSKHLQFTSGVKVYVFLFASFLFDFAVFIVTSLLLIITVACFQEDGFKTGGDLGRLFLCLLYFGVAMIPLVYLMSYGFDQPSTAYNITMILALFTGYMADLILNELKEGSNLRPIILDVLHHVFLFSPHYSLDNGIQEISHTDFVSKLCKATVDACVELGEQSEDECRISSEDSYCYTIREFFKWEEHGIGRNLFFSFSTGLVLVLLLLAIENNWFSRMARCCAGQVKSPARRPDEDSDVAEERQAIRTDSEERLKTKYAVVLREVTKYYKKFLAVNAVSLGIKKYECFGLLGVNGAGKTTTFRIMTGDLRMSRGDAWVNHYNINTQLKQVQKNIGYCPQFDALLDNLTARETLVIFALLRGFPRQECRDVAGKVAQDLDFHQYLHKQIKQLSGGNKRKVSTSLALIGDCRVIYLDEPTAGMDPGTKRILWNVLCQFRDSGRCLILTSHSMEECEVLCTRLTIMVNGSLECLGSTQHLKNKFSQGYTLTIKTNKGSDQNGTYADQTQEFVATKFPTAVLKEKHQELLTFYIEDKSIPVSKIFGVMEKAKKQFNIEDYSLGQASLEQVFLVFTKTQK